MRTSICSTLPWKVAVGEATTSAASASWRALSVRPALPFAGRQRADVMAT